MAIQSFWRSSEKSIASIRYPLNHLPPRLRGEFTIIFFRLGMLLIYRFVKSDSEMQTMRESTAIIGAKHNAQS